mmetsp:Transcript_15683/g.33224  ORF Transcript_15683/g.33224 Transcript_15683/m.33224 type:complete len:178 (-) Transcript_15683:166-699(-)
MKAAMTKSNTILLYFVSITLLPCTVLSFSIQSSLCKNLVVHRILNRHPYPKWVFPTAMSPIYRLQAAKEIKNEDDDDGWDDITTSTLPNSKSSLSDDRVSKSQELARLQDQMAQKQQNQGSLNNYSVDSLGPGNGGEEIDLFIPIFTLVSVIGFTGLYGYEMLRLYLRGELYLPWEN